MSTLAICFLLSSGLVFGLGLVVFVKRAGSAERAIFSYFCLSIFCWLFFYGLMQLPVVHPMFWARIGHAGAIFVPITYLHFVSYFLHIPRLWSVCRAYYGFGVLSVMCLFFTPWYMVNLKQHSWGLYPVGGPLMWLDFVGVVLAASFCWVMFAIRCRQAYVRGTPEEYNRLKYGCIAMTILSLGGYDYVPKLLNVEWLPFGFGTTALFVIIASYAILKRHLMDLSVAIRRTVVYSVLAAVITGVYFSFVLLTEKLLQDLIGYRSLIGSVFAGFIIALGFNPLKELIQRFVDRLFFKGSQAALAAENERLRQELARSEKLKAVATLAAGMAHEIKNPLSSIKTFAEYLPEKHDDPTFREKFARIVAQEVGKVNDLVQRLLEFAKPSPPKKLPARLSNLIDETVEFLNGTLLSKHIEIVRAYSAQDEVFVDPSQMKQVFLNVLLNSIEAMERSGCITIATTQHNGLVHVVVTDTGPGIPKKELPHVFDPFYTTKPNGTGLGLSVVHSIVREHGGRVHIDSDLGRGTAVSITLPTNGRSADETTSHLGRG